MIGMFAAAALGLGGYAGYHAGMLRGAAWLLAAILGAAAAWNWGLPLAQLAGDGKPGAAIAFLLFGQIAATLLFAWGGYHALSRAAPLPTYWEKAGGAALGATAAWLAFGAAFAALRSAPAVNDFAVRQRGGAMVDPGTPDGAWLGLLEHLSARGLRQDVPRPFDAERYLPAPAAAEAK